MNMVDKRDIGCGKVITKGDRRGNRWGYMITSGGIWKDIHSRFHIWSSHGYMHALGKAEISRMEWNSLMVVVVAVEKVVFWSFSCISW